MTNTHDIILQLKAVRDEKQLSFSDILALMEKSGDYLAKSTLSRVFSEGSEDMSFNYESTIRPIANALLEIETIEDTDNLDTKAMKALLKYKIERIEELEKQLTKAETALDREKIKYHEKLDKERERHQKSIDFLTHQIELKDKRMDQLLEAVFEKDKQQKELLTKILACPYGKFD